MNYVERDASLRLLTLRTEYLKANLKGLVKNIEKRVLKKNICAKSNHVDVSWDDWIFAALDCFDPNWHKKLTPNEPIPTEILNRLPIPNGELLSLGNWMLTKNIYRFDDLVARELSKSEFDGMLRNRNDWYTTNRNEWYINTRICT